jgi:hypothetical protein
LAIFITVTVNNPSELPCHLAVLDNTPPTPALPSAQEAKGRPRRIVEGLFYRREGDEPGKAAPRHLPPQSPTGPGKMKKAMERATHYRMTVGPWS